MQPGWSMDHAFDGLIVGIIWGGTTAVGGITSHLPGMNRDDEPGASVVIIQVGIDIDAPAMAVFDAVADPAMRPMDRKIEPQSERTTR
ncbi:MAG: hypothetical protein ABI534_06565 [Chloroflexota bacterium]